MSKSYEKLEQISLSEGLKTAHPPKLPELTHIDDAALDVLIDYQYQKAVSIEQHISIEAALLEMKASDVHMLIVLNKEKEFIGLISSKTILGEKPYQIMQERRIKHSDIQVCMMMLPLEDVLALEYETLQHAKIGNLIEMFKASKRHYAMVTQLDDDQDQTMIRGYFSASRISKSLGSDFTENKSGADTILELKNILKDLK